MIAVLLLAEPAHADEVRDAPGAVSLLRQAARAPDSVGYSGTQFVTVWSREGTAAVLAEVRHSPGQGTSYRVMGGQETGSIHADEISDQTLVDHVISGYEVELAGMDSVAGRDAYVVDVRRDDGSLAARLWTDTATSLLLRREIYNEAGKMVRASGFVDISVRSGAGVSAADSRTMSAQPRPASLPDVSPLPRRLSDELVLHEVNRLTLGSQTVTQVVYSDGLSNVSVFVQRGRLDSEHLDGFTERTVAGTPVYVADGVPQRVTWACYGYVYTVVADVSSTSLETVVAALPHSTASADRSFAGRVVRGLDRVGSWLNPFE